VADGFAASLFRARFLLAILFLAATVPHVVETPESLCRDLLNYRDRYPAGHQPGERHDDERV
jgi:hypothetical protein